LDTPKVATAQHTRTEHWLEGEHGPIRYWASTPQQGTPLLLIHGYGALIEHWQRALPLLSQAHPIYALDLYNFGYSAHVRNPPRPWKAIWARQTAHLINNVIKEPAILVGHSMGGMVAASLAQQHPALVRGLVLVNSVGLPPEGSPNLFERAMFGMVRAPLLGELLAEVMTRSWFVRQGLQSAYYQQERVTDELVDIFSGPLRRPGGPRAYLAISRAFQEFVLDIKPGELTMPQLIIWGSADRAMPPDMALKFKERLLPQASVQTVPQTRHCPFDEDPAAFADILLPWTAELAHA
jgi:pimeloyl-ACP methyl ester carboxylesterase